MDRFRCPTCLTLLEGHEQRCPACRSKLRKRGQPIVLGESARLSSRPALPFERDMRAAVPPRATSPSWRYGRTAAAERAPAATARSSSPEVSSSPRDETLEALLAFEATAIPAVESRIEAQPVTEPERKPAIEPAALVAAATEPAPVPTIEAEPVPAIPAVEPVRPVVDFFADARFEWPEDSPPEPAPVEHIDPVVHIDLVEEERTEAHHGVPVAPDPSVLTIRPSTSPPTEIARLPRVGGELHDIFEALHRKARAEDNDDVSSAASGPSFPSSSLPGSPRAVRPAVPRSPRRRRWMLEFLARRSDSSRA